jgi:hypothetical protein
MALYIHNVAKAIVTGLYAFSLLFELQERPAQAMHPISKAAAAAVPRSAA